MRNSAALNPSVKGATVGQVVGSVANASLSGNISFAGTSTGSGTDFNSAFNGATNINGEPKDYVAVSSDGSIGGLFAAPAWAVANDKLPVLKGAPADIPEYMYPPYAPTNFRAEPANGRVVLYWDAPSNSASITVYEYSAVATGSSDDWHALSGTGGNITRLTIDRLTNGTEYTIKIRAKSKAGIGAAATVDATPCIATVDDVTVSGFGTVALAPAQTATLRFVGVRVTPAGLSGFDASGWVSSLPAGVTVSADAVGGSDQITLTFGGTPTETSDSALIISVPAIALTSTVAVYAESNTNAKFNIASATYGISSSESSKTFADDYGYTSL